MTSASEWVQGARPRTLGAAVAPVLVGTAAAVADADGVIWWRFAAAMVVALALQVGVNYANDYSDGVRGTDRDRKGPLRLTATGVATPRAVRMAAALAFAVAAVVGLVLSLVVNPWLLLVGVAAIAAAVLYTGGPAPLGYLGLGEIMVLVFFGFVATVGSAYVQVEHVPGAAWWGSLVVGLLACAILLANNVRDVPTDTASGKRTLAVRVGAPTARRVVHRVLRRLVRGDRRDRRHATMGAARSPGVAARGEADPDHAAQRRPAVAGRRARRHVEARGDRRGSRERRTVSVLTDHLLRIGDRTVTLVEGPAGWGECSPLAGYPSDPAACRRAAEEAALLGFPPARRDAVPVNALVNARGFDTERLREFPAVKVKVGSPGDVDLVAEVRDAVGPHVALRVDANGAWDVDTAIATIKRLARYDLEIVEQPVFSLDDLARVRRAVDVPVAADECVRSLEDARRLRALDGADAIVLKQQPLGGVRAALLIAAETQLPAIVSSMMETSVGLAAGVALAAALPELRYACGLATLSQIAGDVVRESLVPEHGAMKRREVAPDPELLARYQAASN